MSFHLDQIVASVCFFTFDFSRGAFLLYGLQQGAGLLWKLPGDSHFSLQTPWFMRHTDFITEWRDIILMSQALHTLQGDQKA
jgi:hypothetical protein